MGFPPKHIGAIFPAISRYTSNRRVIVSKKIEPVSKRPIPPDMIFDNDGWDYAQGPGEYHSRILEFVVNEQTKEAELVWEFPGDFVVDPWFTDEFYCPYWGDANRLENGNVLVAAGARGEGSVSHVLRL